MKFGNWIASQLPEDITEYKFEILANFGKGSVYRWKNNHAPKLCSLITTINVLEQITDKTRHELLISLFDSVIYD